MSSRLHAGRVWRGRVVLLALLVLLAGLGLQWRSPAPADASAGGCTWAPGGLGALNCISVLGSGLMVYQSDNEYVAGANPSNVCYQTSRWKYRPNGSSVYRYKDIYSGSCVPGAIPFEIEWNSPGMMADKSSFCSTQKNTATNFVFSPYACVTIYKSVFG